MSEQAVIGPTWDSCPTADWQVRAPAEAGSTRLGDIIQALPPGSLHAVVPPPAVATIAGVGFLEPADLESVATNADLMILAGVSASAAASWLGRLPSQHPRPVALLCRDPSPALRMAARTAGVGVVKAGRSVRWDQVVKAVHDLTERRLGPARPITATGVTDVTLRLSELATAVAEVTGGMVSIEDEFAEVLAYSSVDERADPLRTASILGRRCPSDAVRSLTRTGLYERIRRTDAVIDVPGGDGPLVQPRQVTGIHAPSNIHRAGRPQPRLLGCIWLQQGAAALDDVSAEVLRGAAVVAAQLISSTTDLAHGDDLLLRRLLEPGEASTGPDQRHPQHGGGPFALVALEPAGEADEAANAVVHAVRLRAKARWPSSMTTRIGSRVYVLAGPTRSVSDVTAWCRTVVDQLHRRDGSRWRAAAAELVSSHAEVRAARQEVDRVLRATSASSTAVTTLAAARTQVLHAEIVEMIVERSDLQDPRLQRVAAYDRTHQTALLDSLRTYLEAGADVRAAADAMTVHQNTLRYRLRRFGEVAGIDIDHPTERLMLQLQLAAHQMRLNRDGSTRAAIEPS